MTASVWTLATALIGIVTSRRPHKWPRSSTKCVMASSSATTNPSTRPRSWPSAEVTVARPPDLDLALGDSVVRHGDVRVVVDRHGVVANAEAAAGVVRMREHALDTDVPLRILVRHFAEPEVRVLLHKLEAARLFDGTAKSEGRRLPLLGACEVDRHEPRLAMIVVRLDDQVGDGPLRRIDDDVGELTEEPVGAAHGATQFQTHDSPPLSKRRTDATLASFPGRVPWPHGRGRTNLARAGRHHRAGS